MNYFNPQPTTPDASTHNYTATLADRLSIGGGCSRTRFPSRVSTRGSGDKAPQDLTITPAGNTGNYFAQQARNASRLSWTPVYSFAALNWLGTHDFKAGAYMAESTDNGQVTDHPIDIVEFHQPVAGKNLLHPGAAVSDVGHRVCILRPGSLDRFAAPGRGSGNPHRVAGVIRELSRGAAGGHCVEPFRNTGTVVRAGFGLFYDRVPLSVYSFSQYPNQVVTMFNAGQLSGRAVPLSEWSG